MAKRISTAFLSCLSGKQASSIAGVFVLTLMVLSSFLPGLVNPGAVYADDTFTKLPNPAALPPTDGLSPAFSYDSTYLAIGAFNGPSILIYKRSGDTFTKLPNPAAQPTGNGNGAAFSHDSTYLAVADGGGSFIAIYKRSGDTFTKLPDPAVLPTGFGSGVAFSHDSTYLAVSHDISPFVTIYKRSGDTFTKLPDPATLPGSCGRHVTFNHDSTYMVVTHDNAPFVTIYKRSGDTFTKLADPASLPTGAAYGAAFNPDSTYLAIASMATPYIIIYKRSGDTFTRLPNPAVLPPNVGTKVAFNPDSRYMAVAHWTSPFITIYSRSGDTFTKTPDPAILPAGLGDGVAFSPVSTYMAVTHAASPRFSIYKYPPAAPTITAVNPARGTQGQTMDITIRGNTFFGVMTSNFGPGITVNNVTLNSATQITVNISIAANAAPGAKDVTVTTPGGTATKANAFTVINSSISTTPHGSSGVGQGNASSGPTTTPINLSNVVVQGASLSATTVSPNTPITVTADIINNSTVNGNKKVTVYVNGEIETTQGVTLDSGSSSQLTFNVSRSEPGTYKVYVDGAPAGSFKVEAVTANDIILIASVGFLAIAFVCGLILLRRRQSSSR